MVVQLQTWKARSYRSQSRDCQEREKSSVFLAEMRSHSTAYIDSHSFLSSLQKCKCMRNPEQKSRAEIPQKVTTAGGREDRCRWRSPTEVEAFKSLGSHRSKKKTSKGAAEWTRDSHFRIFGYGFRIIASYSPLRE